MFFLYMVIKYSFISSKFLFPYMVIATYKKATATSLTGFSKYFGGLYETWILRIYFTGHLNITLKLLHYTAKGML